MTNRFNKPVGTRIRDFTQETDAQLAYRLQNEEFKSMYKNNRETRTGDIVPRINNQPSQTEPIQTEPSQTQFTHTELYQTDNNLNADDLTEILVDGGTEIRNREVSDREFALKLQERYSRNAEANDQRNIFTSVQHELQNNIQPENPSSGTETLQTFEIVEPSPKQTTTKSSSGSHSSIYSDEKLAKRLQNKEIQIALGKNE